MVEFESLFLKSVRAQSMAAAGGRRAEGLRCCESRRRCVSNDITKSKSNAFCLEVDGISSKYLKYKPIL